MNIESFREHCLSLKGVTEEFPFDNTILVFKVMGKMFTLTHVDEFERISLKVDPEEGISLRERYPGVQPAYHMNKKHWISVAIDGSVPDRLVISWIDKSYALVASGLTKSQKLSVGIK